ncbi:amidase signature domain-containing protein [Coniochaeta sp. 2T2.1]|nr:amidase signature domain-containing protein [Coniochaeta sp. 2T2.1]
MATYILLPLALALGAHASVFQPSLHALSWKYNSTDFWAPIHLESETYHLQSPGGEPPPPLSRRACHSKQSGGYLGCTVATVQSSADCLSAAYNGTATDVPVDVSFADFITKHGVDTASVSANFKLEGFASTAHVTAVESACTLNNGPYVATLPSCEGVGLGMTPVYALHADHYEAFMEGAVKDTSDASKFQQLHVSLPGSRQPHIIVPSRLSVDASAGPLAGLRFAVKDIFHVKGLKTSGGSRAYYQTYGYQNYTTETVQLTLNDGASLVGKTKTIAFALGVPKNGMEVDYPDPWSPRGDGYQNTGGSSSGSGSAVAAYDWVDFALGSDTGGSVRFPARYGGLYGYKPTHGIYNLTGILVAIAEQDTPGFLARSPEIFTRVGRPSAKVMVEDFFASVVKALDLEVTTIIMSASFLTANVSESNPPQAMAEFMKHVYSDANSVQGWDAIGAPLVEAYGKIPGQIGAFPPADPPVNISWADGQNATTRARYPESKRRLVVFADWFNREVQPASEATCSEHILAHTYHGAPDMVKVKPTQAALTGGWYDGVYTNYAACLRS